MSAGGPLAGVRVVDLTSVVVGPACTRALADHGADVVKVEAPEGDLLRHIANGARNPAMSGKFINFNRNKRSVALDIKRPDGRAALLRLIGGADVFVSNIRPAALARAGLDHASLAADHPSLIHCGIVAFGTDGRYANRPAYDPIIQSLSGVAATFHRATGEPRFVPMVMTDHITGLVAAQAIGFALYRRERTGRGEAIEVPMFETMAAFVAAEHLGAATFDPPLGPAGDNRLLSPEYRPLPTADGFITVAPNTDAQAFAFFGAIGRPELRGDPRFDSPVSRTANAGRLLRGARRRAAATDHGGVAGHLRRAGRAGGAVQHPRDLLTDPHLPMPASGKARNTRARGGCGARASPAASAAARGASRCPAPRIGQHTREVLAEAGFGEAEVSRMLDSGAARAP
jgi:crotonobetainyl-CoA:carnitine CoA-transferase CaiB-like acyl-CoA transferase